MAVPGTIKLSTIRDTFALGESIMRTFLSCVAVAMLVFAVSDTAEARRRCRTSCYTPCYSSCYSSCCKSSCYSSCCKPSCCETSCCSTSCCKSSCCSSSCCSACGKAECSCAAGGEVVVEEEATKVVEDAKAEAVPADAGKKAGKAKGKAKGEEKPKADKE